MIAEWLYTEWGQNLSGNTLDATIERLSSKVSDNAIPAHFVALHEDEVVGFGALKLHEMDIFPDRVHWLGSIYVHPNYRGRGIATKIVQKIIDESKKFAIDCLSLQTERMDGGLYKNLGWSPIQRVHYHGADVLVMERTAQTKNRHNKSVEATG